MTAVVLATVATGLLIAPVATHRLLFRQHEKDLIVTAANRLAKAGLVTLGLTVTTVLALIFSVVMGEMAAYLAAGLAVVFFALCWVGYPKSLGHRVAHVVVVCSGAGCGEVVSG